MAGRRHRLTVAAVVHGAEAGKGLPPGSRARAHTRRMPGKAMTGPWQPNGARRTASAAAPRHAGGADRHGPTQGEEGRLYHILKFFKVPEFIKFTGRIVGLHGSLLVSLMHKWEFMVVLII